MAERGGRRGGRAAGRAHHVAGVRMEHHQKDRAPGTLRRGLWLVVVSVVVFIVGTGFLLVQCEWNTGGPVASENRTFTIVWISCVVEPPLPVVCISLPYDIEWMAYYKEGPGYAEAKIVAPDDWRKSRWVLEHYDQGIWANNSGTNGTLPFYLIFESSFFPYGLTTELVKFTNASRTSTEVVDEYVDAYDGCPHYYYSIGDDQNGLCLHGDDLAYDLGVYGGRGTFTARIAGTCGLSCPGSDEVILTWFVPPP